jgi:hypothetical protein
MRRSTQALAASALAAACALAADAGAAHAAAPVVDAVVEETTFNFPGTGSGSGLATCPTGRRVVGGGLNTTAGAAGSVVLASGPVDETGETGNTRDGDVARGWHASVVHNDGAARTYKVFALCSANSDATVEESRIELAPGASGAARATCPPGRRALGGGIGTAAATLGAYVRVSGPLDETGSVQNTSDGDIARHWYASVSNFTPAQSYRVFALCSAASYATIEETRFNAAAGTSGDGAASCPAGTWATGGGVGTTANTVGSSLQVSAPLGDTGLSTLTRDGDLARHWYASVENFSTPRGYTVAVLCASAPPARSTPLPTTRPRASTAACRVPKLRGKRLATAKRAIRRAGCRVGKVRRRYTRRVRKGRVISQTPRAKARRRVGTKVGLAVSRGPGPRR